MDCWVRSLTGRNSEGVLNSSFLNRYQINGKSYTQEVQKSPFSLLQQQPGEVVITSIAHQQKMCKASVTDLHFNVHQLPSAQVAHGKNILHDIHEGKRSPYVLIHPSSHQLFFQVTKLRLCLRSLASLLSPSLIKERSCPPRKASWAKSSIHRSALESTPMNTLSFLHWKVGPSHLPL
jgi:hypothetical protein